MLRHRLVRRQTPGFTLIELLVVIAIIGVLAALLLPTITAVRCRAKESSAQAMVRDLETAIKSYESDYSRVPPSRAVAATQDDANNQTLVACLSARGPRGTNYYAFRRDALRPPGMPATIDTQTVGAIGYNNFPEAFSPVGMQDTAGNDRLVHNFFYCAPGYIFNRLTGYELWTGMCAQNDQPTPGPANAIPNYYAGVAFTQATTATPGPAAPNAGNVYEAWGGAGDGRYFTKINNWR